MHVPDVVLFCYQSLDLDVEVTQRYFIFGSLVVALKTPGFHLGWDRGKRTASDVLIFSG